MHVDAGAGLTPGLTNFKSGLKSRGHGHKPYTAVQTAVMQTERWIT